MASLLTVPKQFLTPAQQQYRNRLDARAQDRAFTSQINAQTRVINQQNNLVRRLQADFRITPKEVPAFVAATNRALAARQERQRLATERAIARASNPSVAATLQAREARAAEAQRRAILRNAARGIPGVRR